MKAEILFPEVCNLYADVQNIRYLQCCCPELVKTPPTLPASLPCANRYRTHWESWS